MDGPSDRRMAEGVRLSRRLLGGVCQNQDESLIRSYRFVPLVLYDVDEDDVLLLADCRL